jgi:hypothetical protein
MFEGHKIVCVTPAGRRRYMRLLVPQVLGSPLVDRYDIWMNTPDAGDIAFLEGVAKLDARVRLVAHPEGRKPEIEAIGHFHVTACDPDTIYIRLDDDVVWLEPGFFATLLRFRIDHPQYFMVMPLVINNALCSYQLQVLGKIATTQYVRTGCMDEFGWRDPYMALDLHRLLLDLIGKNATARLHVPPREISLNRFSINSLCWFGRDLAPVVGQIGEQEEEDLSVTIPTRLGRANCFCGNTIAAHFSFIHQRDKLERSGLLAEYDRVLAADPALQALRARVEEVNRAADIAHLGSYMPGLYVPVKVPLRRKLRLWWRERPWRKQWKAKARVSAGPAL